MDAKQSPFGVLTEELDGEKAISAIEALNRAGYRIIHHDENHGPTLGRAAETVEKANYPCAGDARRIAAAIRAMGEKK